MHEEVHLGRETNVRLSVGYVGTRNEDGTIWVAVYSYGRWRSLPFCLGTRSLRPDCFNWGFFGSSCAQLALALLRHATGKPTVASALFHHFLRAVVCRLHRRRWHLTQRFIRKWCRRYFASRGDVVGLHEVLRGMQP